MKGEKCTAKLLVREGGRVEAVGLQDREAKKKKIHEALLATGIDPVELPVLTIEMLAERVPVQPFAGLEAQEASALNPAASVLVGAML